MNLYVEPSAVLAWLLDEPTAVTVRRLLGEADVVVDSGKFIVRAKRSPPAWITCSPLLPLAAFLLTDLYLFAPPPIVRRRYGGTA